MGIDNNYNWLYWTFVARLLNKTDGDIPPGASQMETIEAVYGRLRDHDNTAANDLVAAALFILLLILWWNYAKTAVKLSSSGPVLRKLTSGVFLEAIPANPAWLRLFPVCGGGIGSAKTITSPQR